MNDNIDYYDLTMVFSGELHYNIDGNEYVLKKGDAVFIRPGSHRRRYADEHPAHYFSINFFSNVEDDKSIPEFIPGCSSALKDALLLKNVRKTFKPL